MKKIFLFSFLMLTALYSFSQASGKIKVDESSHTVNAIPRKGQQVIINLDKEKDIDNAWNKKLKTWGKVESVKGAYIVNGAIIKEISSSPCIIYSAVHKSGSGVRVWWSIDMGHSHLTANSDAYKKAQKILYDFAVEMYTADVNEQIQAAEKALATSVKNQEKTVQKGTQLLQDIENNKKEKISLEQKIQENAAELQQLNKDVEQNKVDQQSAVQDVEKMKKALEQVKGKLTQIE